MAFAILVALPAVATPDFAREILPILQRSCYVCHGPAKQKSGYRLDVRDAAVKGGESGHPAIKPHDAAASPLIRYVSGEDPDMQMPPMNSGVTALSADEVALLRAWIDAGPSWPDELSGAEGPKGEHWSLKPLVRPKAPDNEANPIDAFVHAKLAEKKLTPSLEADRATLIRRVCYDLTGLPPAPQEVAAFAADPDPQAYDKLVDRLLASPRHGERWARHWLDTIHYADSYGFEHDLAREHAWRYRDYVITAFNNDTSWDRFIREQLAADAFYPDEPQLTPALGFLGAGTFDLSTFTTAPVTFDYIDRDDMVTQTMSAFVSTTANCARCHAHKFDPIPQEDYYALQAVFSGVQKGDLAYDADPRVFRERKRWTELMVAADMKDAAALLTPEHEAQVYDWLTQRGEGAAWTPLDTETFLSDGGAELTRGEDGVITSGGKRPEKDTYTLTATTTMPLISALRLDVHALESLPMKGPGRNDNGNFHLSEFEARVFEPGGAAAVALKFKRATADFNQADWGIEEAIDGKEDTAWGVDPQEGKPHYAVFELADKLAMKPGARLAITLKQLHGSNHVIGAFSLSVSGDAAERTAALPSDVAAALALPEAERTEEQRVAIAAHALRLAAEDALHALPEPQYVYAAARDVIVVMDEGPGKPHSLPEPKPVHLLERGDFDKPKDEIAPGALSALTHLPGRFGLKNAANESERRAALAEWIAHPDNSLTWRSIVNRVWHYHFGRGLCDTPSDLGEMGGAPSHPELIDWLAVWFRDDAHGSLKALHRLIVTSETYRQSSQHRDDPAEIDGDNRLLWRQNRQRLDADAYRDFALAASGRLDLALGGPGIKHFTQSKGPQITPALDYTAYDWNSPTANRRSIYRFVWRGIPDPFMEAMDFPDLGQLSPVRGFSASSLQALALYNNDFVLAQSSALAQRAEREAPEIAEQVKQVVLQTWLRYPTDFERADFTQFAETNSVPALCRVLFNSDEFLFVD